jgi:putative component of membrane protein insertase Oxa1/YidC/SpoIIIJ protein YidD
MMTAIERYGIIKGIGLGIKRLGRCHPGCEGGVDHVPELKPKASQNKHTCGHKHD